MSFGTKLQGGPEGKYNLQSGPNSRTSSTASSCRRQTWRIESASPDRDNQLCRGGIINNSGFGSIATLNGAGTTAAQRSDRCPVSPSNPMRADLAGSLTR